MRPSRDLTRGELLKAGAAGALGLYVAGCGGDGQEQQAPQTQQKPKGGGTRAVDVGDVGANPVVIGLVLGISGSNSPLAPSTIQATQLAVEEVNAAGGILDGRKIKLVLGDDGTDPRVSRQAWDSVLNQQRADAVIALETSASRNAGVPVAEKAGKPAIYTSLYEGSACSPILYVNAEVPNQQIDPEVTYLTRERDVKSFFLVGSDYVWPRTTFKIAKDLIAKAGAEVVGEEYAPIGTTDWSAVVSKIQNTSPDSVYFALAGGSDNVALMKQFRATGSEAIVVSPDIEENVLKALGEDGEGVVMAGAYFQVLDTSENKKFLAALKKRFGAKAAPQNLLSVPNYDALHQFALAMDKAKSTRPEAVLEALAEVTFTGPRGEIKMTRDRHATLPIYLAIGQADSTFKIIKDLGAIPPTNQCEPDPSLRV
jgi:urea transport system substrate-binding protein